MNFDDVVQSFKFETETMSLPIMSDWFRREHYYYCVLQNPRFSDCFTIKLGYELKQSEWLWQKDSDPVHRLIL